MKELLHSPTSRTTIVLSEIASTAITTALITVVFVVDSNYNSVTSGCEPLSITAAKTGALSMGFWQNKNGQNIIKSQSGTPCPWATYLPQFAPFQDLSLTASCSILATYVANVMGAAEGSRASMNAIFKGQMLATALDAYFSASITDTTHCSGTITIACGGSRTCSNVYENTVAAFGRQTKVGVPTFVLRHRLLFLALHCGRWNHPHRRRGRNTPRHLLSVKYTGHTDSLKEETGGTADLTPHKEQIGSGTRMLDHSTLPTQGLRLLLQRIEMKI